MIVAGFIFPFANNVDKYFSYTMPAFFIGSAGAMFAYQNGNIAIFQATPPRIAGTVGAMFNCALQLGSAVGAAIITSIQTSVQAKLSVEANEAGPRGYQSRADVFWFVLRVVVIEALSVLVFYRPGQSNAEARPQELLPAPSPEDVIVIQATASKEKSVENVGIT